MNHRTLRRSLVHVYCMIVLSFVLAGFWVSLVYAQKGEFGSGAQAKKQLRLAVLDFRDEAQLAKFERAALADSVRGASLETPFMVMTKENMTALLPVNTKLEECVDDCEVEVGRTLGAHYIITGIIGRIDQKIQLLLRLYETRQGSLVGQATLNAQTVGELQPKVRRASLKLLTELSPALNTSLNEQRTLLFIRLKPSSAKVKLDGFPLAKAKLKKVKGGLLVSIKPGRHRVEAKSSGFITKSVQLKVQEGEPVEADLRLKRKQSSKKCYDAHCKADVFVFTQPAGAKIYLDGKYTGLVTKTSSLDPHLGSVALRVSAGKHWISARKTPFDDTERLITVEGNSVYNEFREKPLKLRRAKGKLIIKSEPKGALVRLNGQVIGKTPLSKSGLDPRPYWVEVLAEGFKSREELVTVQKNKTKKLRWSLTSSTAKLKVRVSYRDEPVKGAAIWLDEQRLGETDDLGYFSTDKVMTGQHLIQAKHPLYVAEAETITLHGGKLSAKRLQMKGAYGYLSIDISELEDELKQWHEYKTGHTQQATQERPVLLWGGVSLDNTQLKNIKVSAGRRWLQVRPPVSAENIYASFNELIRVRVGQETQIKPSWKRHRSLFSINSPSVKSEVFIDGQSKGYTPLSTTLKSGLHQLEVHAPQASPYRKVIWLTREGMHTEVNFEKRTVLSINCQPIQGLIYLDGLEVGLSPQTLDVTAGEHTLTCSARGAQSQKTVQIEPGQSLKQTVTIPNSLFDQAFRKRERWRLSSKVGMGMAGIAVLSGSTVLLSLLPTALEQRANAEQNWVAELSPQTRNTYAQQWANADAQARNHEFLGWGLISTGVGIALSSALTLWINQE